MKLNKLVFPLMLALVATVAFTGCKKGFSGGITKLPGERAGVVGGEQLPPTLPPGQPFPTEPTITTTPTTGPIAYDPNKRWDPANMIQDRATLADQTVHFAFDSAAVLSKEESKLVIVSEKLKSDPSAYMLIEGHCDERGTDEYNRSLGERRALALREALIRSGIEDGRVQTISFGKDKPADTGHDEAAWAKNRRGEFILCHQKTGA